MTPCQAPKDLLTTTLSCHLHNGDFERDPLSFCVSLWTDVYRYTNPTTRSNSPPGDDQLSLTTPPEVLNKNISACFRRFLVAFLLFYLTAFWPAQDEVTAVKVKYKYAECVMMD